MGCSELAGEGVARRGLELRAVPALVDGVRGGERLVGGQDGVAERPLVLAVAAAR